MMHCLHTNLFAVLQFLPEHCQTWSSRTCPQPGTMHVSLSAPKSCTHRFRAARISTFEGALCGSYVWQCSKRSWFETNVEATDETSATATRGLGRGSSKSRIDLAISSHPCLIDVLGTFIVHLMVALLTNRTV